MEILNPDFKLEQFWLKVERAAERALLLDYDGTLAPFQVQRDQAKPYPGVGKILSTMQKAKHSRIVLISGRSTNDLIPLLDFQPIPEIWGSHGVERRLPDGSYETAELPEAVQQTLAEIADWLKDQGLAEQFEKKPGALAIHWRAFSSQRGKQIRESILERWQKPAEEAGLLLREFDGGIEFRTGVRDKGWAVQAILSELNQDNLAAAYLGDDLTDEDAFKALKGKGTGVLVRTQLRETSADVWLTPPDELLDFLSTWHQRSGG